MARNRKLTTKYAGFPMFKVGTSGDTFPMTSPFTTEFTGLDGLALDLQFATDKTLTARKGPTPVFTRGSTGTFVGSNGLIQSAGNNVARFDHDPVTLACKGLLMEESRTNASWYSGALVVGTGWSANATPSVTSVVDGLGPDGNNAYEIAEIANTGSHTLFNTGGSGTTGATSVVSGTTYTGSIFVKKVAGSIDWIQLSFSAIGFGSVQYANFNISNGTIGNFSSSSPKIQDAGNGWYRCSVSAAATTTTTTTSNLFIGFTNNTDTTTRLPSYAGNTANKILAAMVQFEAGAFTSSYIPTTTASVIRSADVCSITGSAFSGFYNQSAGTLESEVMIANLIGNNRGIVQIDDNTNNSVLRHVYGLSDGGFRTIIRANADVATTLSTTLGTASVIQKRALAYEGTSFASVTNGGAVTTITRTMPVGLSILRIGNLAEGSFYLSGHIAAIRYYKQRLSNAKLQAITV